MGKKSKRVAFTFNEQILTTLENMTQEGHFSTFSDKPVGGYTEITIKDPQTDEQRVIKIPALPPLVRVRL